MIMLKLALRTSSHLLLGVVRIYSRKAKCLLADCNEAFVKIKLVFRPGMIDLPAENREASLRTINILQDFTSFDLDVVDFKENNVIANFGANQSHPENITLHEVDLCKLFLDADDDDFGDFGFNPGISTIAEVNLDDILFDQNVDQVEFLPTELLREQENHHIEDDLELMPVDIAPERRKRKRRRKRLIIDKVISIERMNGQLDSSDLVRLLDHAPFTKKMMYWKENGGVDKLFILPGKPVVNKKLFKLFSQNLATTQVSTDNPGMAPVAAEVEDLRPDDESRSGPTPTLSEKELEEAELGKKLWNQHSTQMEHILQHKLETSSITSFRQLTARNNRKQAALKFYTILVLTKARAITVEQQEPFGDIQISRGPDFAGIM